MSEVSDDAAAAPGELEFAVGPLGGGATVSASGWGPKRRAVLALLLLNANRVVPTDRLIDELWGDERETVRAALQSTSPGCKGAGDGQGTQNVAPDVSSRSIPSAGRDRFDSLRAEARVVDVALRSCRCTTLGLWRDALSPSSTASVSRRSQPPSSRMPGSVRPGANRSDLELGRHAEVISS
jgi:hypothetical protein